jgi:hypothetical protein
VMALAPSLGRWRAEEPAVFTILTRSLGLAYMVALATGSEDEGAPAALYLPGVLLVATSVIYDLARTGDAARDYNKAYAKRRATRGAATTLGPTLIPTQNGSFASGLSFGGSF